MPQATLPAVAIIQVTMDDSLLSRLPDRAKLAILAHLELPISSGAATVAHSQCSDGSRAAQGSHVAQEVAEQQEQTAAATLPASTPPALAGRSLPPLSLLVIDGFSDATSVAAVRAEASAVIGARSRSAGMGGGGAVWRSSAFRSDRVAFVRPAELRAEGHGLLAALLERLSSTLQPWLAAQGWDVGGRPTFQLGLYPGSGARYCRHADRHPRSAPRRRVSAVLYLQQPGWRPEDGGQLVVYDQAHPPEAALAHGEAALASGLDAGLPGTVVPPLGGRLVVFDSRLVHEVLPAQMERVAIACWFTCSEEAAAGGGGGSAAPADHAAAEQLSSQVAAARLHPSPWTVPVRCAAASSSRSSSRGCSRNVPDRSITRPGAIFVSIASFRDPETQWTLADLFAKAAEPDLLSVGVVWQVDWEQDSHFVRIAAPPQPGECSSSGTSCSGCCELHAADRRRQLWQHQLRQVVLDAGEATGPCKARALAEQLWQGEEFVLQVRWAVSLSGR